MPKMAYAANVTLPLMPGLHSGAASHADTARAHGAGTLEIKANLLYKGAQLDGILCVSYHEDLGKVVPCDVTHLVKLEDIEVELDALLATTAKRGASLSFAAADILRDPTAMVLSYIPYQKTAKQARIPVHRMAKEYLRSCPGWGRKLVGTRGTLTLPSDASHSTLGPTKSVLGDLERKRKMQSLKTNTDQSDSPSLAATGVVHILKLRCIGPGCGDSVGSKVDGLCDGCQSRARGRKKSKSTSPAVKTSPGAASSSSTARVSPWCLPSSLVAACLVMARRDGYIQLPTVRLTVPTT